MFIQILLIALLALMTAAVALLIVLLVRQGRAERGSRQAWQSQQQLLNDFANDVLDELDEQREAANTALQQLSMQVMNTLTQLTQAQTATLESIQRQTALQSQAQQERIGQSQAALAQASAQLDTRMEQLRQSVTSAMDTLRQENDRQLTEMRRTVDEKLTASLDKRLNDSFAQVSQRLEQVYKGLGEMQSLAGGVSDLKRVLTNVKTRGIWGEMQLGALLEQTLAPGQYACNVAVIPGRDERVEFAIRLPGSDSGVIYLPIDSKFPQEDYLRLVEQSQQGNAEAAEEARRALMTRIRTEAKRIAGKYIQAPHTTDFAVMFLPVEGLYAEVVRDPDTVERIQREQRVIIAGPSTFAALLNALQMGFRTLAIQQRSGEVWQLLGAVKSDFAQFADVLEKTRQRLQQATDSIDTAFTRTRSIQRRLGAVELPGASQPEGENFE